MRILSSCSRYIPARGCAPTRRDGSTEMIFHANGTLVTTRFPAAGQLVYAVCRDAGRFCRTRRVADHGGAFAGAVSALASRLLHTDAHRGSFPLAEPRIEGDFDA